MKEESEESDDSEDPYYIKEPKDKPLDPGEVRCEPDVVVSLKNY